MTVPASLRRGLVVTGVTVAALAVLFVVGECVARWVSKPDPRDEGERHGIAADLRAARTCFLTEGSGEARRLVERPTPDAGRAPVSYPFARRPGVTRIALVGESNAFILGNRILALLASAGGPGADRVEIVNCGLPGSPMAPTMRRFREVLDYAPDAVVVIYGHNIHYEDEVAPPSLRALELQELRSRSVLLTRLFRALGGDGGWSERPDWTPPEDPFTDEAPKRASPRDPPPPWAQQPPPERRRAIFRRMIEHMIAEAKTKRVPLVLTTMASNRLMAPSVTAEDLARPEVIDAEYFHDAHRPAEAAAALAQAMTATARPWPRFLQGEWQLEAGDAAAARTSFERAVALDTGIPRATEEQNEFVRRLAAREGALLHDPERALAATAPGGILGWETFNDCCHYVPAREASEAAAIFALAQTAARASSPVVLPVGKVDPGQQDNVSRFFSGETNTIASASSEEQRRQPALDLPRGVARWFEVEGDTVDARFHVILAQWPPNAPRENKAVALAAVAEGYWRAGRRSAAEALLAGAAEAAPLAQVALTGARWRVRAGHLAEARASLEALGAVGRSVELERYLGHIRADLDSPTPPRPPPPSP